MNCTGILILLGIINLVFAIILLRRFGILGYKKAREAVIGSVVEDTLAVVEKPRSTRRYANRGTRNCTTNGCNICIFD